LGHPELWNLIRREERIEVEKTLATLTLSDKEDEAHKKNTGNV